MDVAYSLNQLILEVYTVPQPQCSDLTFSGTTATHYQPGTRTRYKVTVTDGFDNVCGTKEFSIQY